MTTELAAHVAQPADGAPTRRLVILLHGVGSDGADLFGLVPHLAPHLPDTAFVAPDAPAPYDMAPFGRQWYSLQDRSPAAKAAGARAAAPILDAFIDHQRDHFGLTDDAVALIGFSQGTMMSLQVAPRRPKPVAAVIGFSGAVVDPATLGAELRSRPRVLLIHGDSDPVVDPANLASAEQCLSAVGVPVLTEMRPGLEHSIDGPGLGLALAFLRHAFGLADA